MSKNFVIEVMVADSITVGSLIQLKSKVVAHLPKFRKHVIDINLVDEDKYLKSRAMDMPHMEGFKVVSKEALERWARLLGQAEEYSAQEEIKAILKG